MRSWALLGAVLAILVAGGCAPLRYLARNPVPVPVLEAVPEVRPYTPAPDDCPRYQWTDADGWTALPWSAGVRVSTVPPGFRHPATDGEGYAACLQIVVPPGAWIESREARDRLPLVEAQRDLLLDYIGTDRSLDEEEQRRIIELVKTARRRQVEAFAVGVGVGGVVVTVVAVAVAVAVR